MYLNLDQSFKPYKGDEVTYESFNFPGGEPHIKITSDVSGDVIITHRIRSFNDFGTVFLAIDALKRMDCKDISLMLPYFPAARQDRVMVKGEPLTVKVFANMINAFNLKNVYIFDPHSEVTPALLNNCKVIYN